MKKQSLNEKIIYLERDIIRNKHNRLLVMLLNWKKKKLEKKIEKEWLKDIKR